MDTLGTRSTTAPTRGNLLNRTMVILGGQIGLAWLGALATWSLTLTKQSYLLLTLAFIVTCVISMIWTNKAADDDPSPVIGAGIFAFTTGAYIGPVLAMQSETLGASVVTNTCAATLGALAITGILSTFISFKWRKVENWLMLGLWGLIGYYIVAIFISTPSPPMHQGISFVGAGLFLLFMLVDFVRLVEMGKSGEHTWKEAVIIANNLFLDAVNFLLHVLGSMDS